MFILFELSLALEDFDYIQKSWDLLVWTFLFGRAIQQAAIFVVEFWQYLIAHVKIENKKMLLEI